MMTDDDISLDEELQELEKQREFDGNLQITILNFCRKITNFILKNDNSIQKTHYRLSFL